MDVGRAKHRELPPVVVPAPPPAVTVVPAQAPPEQKMAPAKVEPRVQGPSPSAPGTESKRTFAPAQSWGLELQGRKHDSVLAFLTPDDFVLLAATPDTELFSALHRCALLRLGYSAEAVAEIYLDFPITRQREDGSKETLTVAGVRDWIASPGDGSFGVGKELRQEAYRAQLYAENTPAAGKLAVAAFSRDLALDAQLASLDAKFRSKMAEAGTLLQQSFVMVDWQKTKKAKTDEVFAQADDIRGEGSWKGTADAIETGVRFILDHQLSTRFLPESVKQRVVDLAIGSANGGMQIGAGACGIGAAYTDLEIDVALFVLKKAGVDTRPLQRAVRFMREQRMEF